MEANLIVSVATIDHPAEISSRAVEIRSKIPAPSNPAPPDVLCVVPTASEISLGSGLPVGASFTIDAPRVLRPSISISGQTFHLPVQPSAAILHSLSLAANFNRWFNLTQDSLQQLHPFDLTNHFQTVQKLFAPDAFESAALTFVNNFGWTKEIGSIDFFGLSRLGPGILLFTAQRGWHEPSAHQSMAFQ